MSNLVVMIRCNKNKKLGKYKLITIAMVLACMTANHEAFASNIPVTNSTELKNAINSATAANTIVLSNDIITIYNPISFNINKGLFGNTLESIIDVMSN